MELHLVLLLQLLLELLGILTEGDLGALELGDQGFLLLQLPALLGYTGKDRVSRVLGVTHSGTHVPPDVLRHVFFRLLDDVA